MRLSEYCSAVDIDRAISVAVDSFIGSHKVSCKRALARAFGKYTLNRPGGGRGGRRGKSQRESQRGVRVGA